MQFKERGEEEVIYELLTATNQEVLDRCADVSGKSNNYTFSRPKQQSNTNNSEQQLSTNN